MLSTYKISVFVPRQLNARGSTKNRMSREDFYEWIWNQFKNDGLLGIHEGTLLSDEAFLQGLEKNSWTVDSAEAPQGRDWVGSQDHIEAEIYFSDYLGAAYAVSILNEFSNIELRGIKEEKHQDWNAEWRASFLNSGSGILIPPFWKIVPPWFEEKEDVSYTKNDLILLRINPGAGFGTGTHETTQICLEAIGKYWQELQSSRDETGDVHALDFGSGSGILSIAMALLGAKVDAVEVDSLAIDNAKENLILNGVQDKVTLSEVLPEEVSKYHIIVANILRPVLLEFAEALRRRLHPQGVLILSGLIDNDVSAVTHKYGALFESPAIQNLQQGEWMGIVFSNCPN